MKELRVILKQKYIENNVTKTGIKEIKFKIGQLTQLLDLITYIQNGYEYEITNIKE